MRLLPLRSSKALQAQIIMAVVHTRLLYPNRKLYLDAAAADAAADVIHGCCSKCFFGFRQWATG